MLLKLTDFTGEAIESKIYILRRLLNELSRVQKSKSETLDSIPMMSDEEKEAFKKKIKNIEEMMNKSGENGTFKNVANITTETENGEVIKEEINEEKKDEEKPEL